MKPISSEWITRARTRTKYSYCHYQSHTLLFIDKEYWSIILNMLWVLGKKNNCEILLKSSKKSLTLYPWEWIASKSLKYQPWVKGLALKALDCQTNVQRSAWRQSSKRVGILLRKRLFLLNTILVNMTKRLWLDIVMNITTYGE